MTHPYFLFEDDLVFCAIKRFDAQIRNETYRIEFDIKAAARDDD